MSGLPDGGPDVFSASGNMIVTPQPHGRPGGSLLMSPRSGRVTRIAQLRRLSENSIFFGRKRGFSREERLQKTVIGGKIPCIPFIYVDGFVQTGEFYLLPNYHFTLLIK